MTYVPERALPPTDTTRRPRLVVSLLLAVAALAFSVGCGSDTDTAAQSDKLEGLERTPPMEVGDVVLPEVAPGQSDKPFNFTAPNGKLLFVTFGYTNCPDICPTTLSDVRKARQLLGDDAERVEVSFVTVDPDRDLPEVIKPYISSFVPTGHAIRTEDAAALEAAKSSFGVRSSVTKNAEGDIEVTHSAKSFVVDDEGRIVVEWPFGVNSEAMAHDLAILLARP